MTSGLSRRIITSRRESSGDTPNWKDLGDRKILWLGIGFGVVFWFLEAFLHTLLFFETDLIREIFVPNLHELWMRLIVIALFITFAIYAQIIITKKKAAENAVKLAYAELNQIFQTAADGMRVVDKDFNVRRVNETFVKLSGVGQDEAIGRKCYEIFRGPKCHTPECPLTRIIAGESLVEYDAEKQRSDGSVIPCIVTATPFRSPDGEFYGIVEDFKDISDRNEAEDALRASEERLRTILDAIQAGVVLIDAETHAIVDVNPVAEELVGTSKEEIIGHICHKFICPAEQGRCPITDLGQTIDKSERVLITAKGDHIPILKTVTPITVSGRRFLIDSFIDIREVKEAEEHLRQSEERYRTLFEDSRDAILITSGDDTIIDINQSALDLFGYTQEEMVGSDGRSTYFDPEDRNRFQRDIEKTGSVRDYEIRLRKRDGTKIDCLISSTLRRSADGGILGYQSIVRDITEKKRLEAQFRHAQKMEAIGTLAGGIAHDFNNLLMSIQGNISLALMDTDPSTRLHERLQAIETQIEKGAKLTSHLLGYAREGGYEVQPLDLNKLVQETSSTFGRTKKDIMVRRELAADLSAVEADTGQIEQVLWNLYINAADAMPGGGDLILKTVNTTHLEMTGKLYEPKPGKYVLLSVSDTGVGMDKEILERIFEPFFTTKEMGRGTGLGLASAYGIVKAHGGYIDADSWKGHGTTFSIYLPSSDKGPQEAVKHDDRFVEGKETVLLVDDEEAVRQVGRDLLEAMGYHVMTAESGQKAVEMYKRYHDRVDIILLDMVMPQMGGGEVFDRVKEIDTDVKVLLLSGYSIHGEANEILLRGCDGFIQKPFNMERLSGTIREILDKG